MQKTKKKTELSIKYNKISLVINTPIVYITFRNQSSTHTSLRFLKVMNHSQINWIRLFFFNSFSHFNIKLNTCRHSDYLFEQIF